MINLNEQITAFALHLIEREAMECPRGNNRSSIEHEKFLISTRWLCRKLLLAWASHEEAKVRISRDANRYKAGKYVPKGISYDVTIKGALDLMETLDYVEKVSKGRYSREKSKGEQTRYRPTDAFLKHFQVVSSTLPKQLVGHEDTDPIVVQKTVKRTINNKDGTRTKIKYKKKFGYNDTPQIIRWRDNLTIINDCFKRHWADLYLTDEHWAKLNTQLLTDKDHDYSPIQLHRATLRRVFNSQPLLMKEVVSMGLGGIIYLMPTEPLSLLMGSSLTSLIMDAYIPPSCMQIRVLCWMKMPTTLASEKNTETL